MSAWSRSFGGKLCGMNHPAGETTAGYGIKARGPNPQFFGARSQISVVDADWPVFKKCARTNWLTTRSSSPARMPGFFSAAAEVTLAPLHLDDDAIETMVRALIEAYLADDARNAALNWLEKRTLTYQAVQSLRLLDSEP
jgi:hypothetical protein